MIHPRVHEVAKKHVLAIEANVIASFGGTARQGGIIHNFYTIIFTPIISFHKKI